MATNVRLESSDGRNFEVLADVAKISVTIQHMLEDITAHSGESSDENPPIPLPNVNGTILEKVLEFCKYHQENPDDPAVEKVTTKRTDDIAPWDKDWISKVDQQTLFDLILAANYLDIKPLLDLTCKTVAHQIKECKTQEDLRKKFNITVPFTPEDEEATRKENENIIDL
eukprot:TRINITY_DN1977_c0_g1_i1.p1 TRINITY_DN1977_c0_g1~~TRINITY_DN1977_c0_g1_i1.p1  ORF type:complete len:170 (-),score=34.41 TRINITY_DN1977_c0_g1_i1:70-579(-)